MSQPVSETDLLVVYRRTIEALYAFVSRRVGGDRALAEDVVQEAWMRAVRDWPHRGMPDRPLAWLRRVAGNVIASHFRRTRPAPIDPATIDLADERFHPESPESAALVGWGMATMRRRQVELLEAFHFEGKTVAEIAGQTGMSERAVEGRLRRARAKLRRRLAPHLTKPNGDLTDARKTPTR